MFMYITTAHHHLHPHLVITPTTHPSLQDQWQLLQGDVLDEQETYELIFRHGNDDVRGCLAMRFC